jgi:hypothetical protein
MLPLRGCLFALAATACLAAPAPVSAALINYVFDPGTSAIFGKDLATRATETITGSFTFDTGAVPGGLPETNITLRDSGSGPFHGGSITLTKGQNTGVLGIKADNIDNNGFGTSVEIDFEHSLADGTHDDLGKMLRLTIMTSFLFNEFADGVTGAVTPTPTPTPEPTSLALMAAALGLSLLVMRFPTSPRAAVD